MLCPHKKLDAFDANSAKYVPPYMPTYLLTCFRTIKDLQDGKISVMACNWPMIFYEDNVYDPENWLEGLFHSHAALRVSFCFYFSQLLSCFFNSSICISLSGQLLQQQILLWGSPQDCQRITSGVLPGSCPK